MELFRNVCGASGKITEDEKKLVDDLADSWKMIIYWTKGLPRYKAFSDYEEKDIECLPSTGWKERHRQNMKTKKHLGRPAGIP